MQAATRVVYPDIESAMTAFRDATWRRCMSVRTLSLMGFALAFAVSAPRTSVGQVGARSLLERGEQLAVMAAGGGGRGAGKEVRNTHRV